MQKQITDYSKIWQKIKEQIKINKTPRISWIKIFKKSLSNKIAGFYRDNRTPEECYWILHKELSDLGYDGEMLEEMMRRIEIGIAARYGEINSASKEFSRK